MYNINNLHPFPPYVHSFEHFVIKTQLNSLFLCTCNQIYCYLQKLLLNYKIQTHLNVFL